MLGWVSGLDPPFTPAQHRVVLACTPIQTGCQRADLEPAITPYIHDSLTLEIILKFTYNNAKSYFYSYVAHLNISKAKDNNNYII